MAKTPSLRHKTPRAADLPPCLVVWEDALHTDHDGALADTPTKTVVNHTIGFLTSPHPSKHARGATSIVQEVSPEEDSVRWVLTIPRGMVRGILVREEFVRYAIEHSGLDPALRSRLLNVLSKRGDDASEDHESSG